MRIERIDNQVVSRSAGMAGGHDAGGGLLSTYPWFSQGGDVRFVVADQAIRRFHSSKYCRGAWAGEYPVFYSVPSDRPGFIEGVGNAFDACGTSRHSRKNRNRPADCIMRNVGTKAKAADPVIAAQGCPKVMAAFAIRYSPFAIRLAIHNSSIKDG